MLRANCQSPLVVPCPERFGDPDAEVGGDYRTKFQLCVSAKVRNSGVHHRIGALSLAISWSGAEPFMARLTKCVTL
jgi:hypothetical protein